MAKRKISGVIRASQHPMTMDTAWNQPQGDGTYHAYDGDDVEAFLKQEISSRAKGVTVNGMEAQRDPEGNVSINVDVVNVDASLDPTSTNAISNAAASQAINELDNNTVSSMDVEENDDGETIRLSLLNKSNQTIAYADLPKGGGGDVSLSRISIRASIDKARVKEGGNAMLTYTYDHIDGQGNSDGVRGNLEITVKRGTTITYQNTIENVPAGTTGFLDISPYLLAGTVDVYVKATCVTADSQIQTRQAYTNISVITLNLTSSFNISSSLIRGGYGNETIEIPYTLTGAGSKAVTLYIDGRQVGTPQTVTTAGTTNGVFTIQGSSYSAGRHNIQIVAEREGLLSDSIYMDFLIAGSNRPFIGSKITFKDGRIYTSAAGNLNDLTPTIEGAQYEQGELNFVAWNPNNVTADIIVREEGVETATMSVGRQMQKYQFRYAVGGLKHLSFACGATTYPFNINVSASSLNITEITSGLRMKLSASGRSNGESNPATWAYGDLGNVAQFFGFDWNTSGWTGDALRLRNGARTVIGYKPFANDAKANGLTVEMELMISNVMDREGDVVSCMHNGKGFKITAEEAQFFTGNTKINTDADGEETESPVGVAMNFAPGLLLKIAFVLHTNAEDDPTKGHSLMQLFINGVLSKVDDYGSGDFFRQDVAQDITIDSTYADVEVRNIRIYERALSDEEELTNYIVDRPTGEEMIELYNKNDILGDDGQISADKIIARHKAVCVIIPQSHVNEANSMNDKNADFEAAKVYFYSPFGEEYNFVAENCYFRIQGTSSTKYPRKNYRLYLAKGTNPTLRIGGVLQTERDSRNKLKNNYQMRPGCIPANLFCLKCDYTDTAMVMNTGGAKLFNEVTKELGLLTPPQTYQQQNNNGNITVRQAVDGIPCDLFVAETDGGEMTYYGQYNFNNEKSKSEKIFGMELSGFEPTCPICLESLDNGNPCCLFQSPGIMNSQTLADMLNANFDKGFEFNYPEDVWWTQAQLDKKGKGTLATDAQRNAVKRLFGWIYECIPSAMRSNPDYADISKWVSSKFKNEVSSHFDVQHLLTYYLVTDYWVSVDQRVKNILWRTWDGIKWYATFYDGDTAQGMRNDSYLVYKYNVTRESRDTQKSKWVFEGHDSVLWCLVLANLESELKAAANDLRARGKLDTARMLQMFNVEQMGNWCERQYNQSGKFKYITPRIEGVLVTKDNQEQRVIYRYLFGLTGNREAHRTAFLTDRGNLLDARYATSSYQDDRAEFYAIRSEGDPTQNISIESGDLYYYGYRRNNGEFIDGPTRAEKGETIALAFNGTLAINDPLNLCGASRITKLDWRTGPTVTGDFKISSCRMLKELNFSNEYGLRTSALILTGLENCIQLERIDVTGQTGISTTTGAAELNLGSQIKLKSVKAGSTGLADIKFAEGCPVNEVVMPASLKTLRLRYLPKLTESGLQILGYNNVETFNFAACPNLDWEQILSRCNNVIRVRVEGLKGKISLATLNRYKNLQGVDANGNGLDNCALVGTVMLDEMVTDEVLNDVRSYYPELTINNAAYSDYVENDDEINTQNITNMDNQTGFLFNNDYEASGHVVKIREKSKPVKGTYNATTEQMHLTPMSENTYRQLADGSTFDPSDAIGEGFDVFMYIPKFYYKGINDYKNQQKHTLLSSNSEAPANSWNIKKEGLLSELLFQDRYGLSFANITEGEDFDTEAAMLPLSNSAVYRIDVEEMRQVRYPSINNQTYASVFVDEDGKVVQKDRLYIVATGGDTGTPDYANGDYIYRDVPSGAKWLYFTTLRGLTDEDHPVFAVDTDDIEAIEPGWVEHKSELIGVYGASIDDLGSIRSLSGKRTRTGTGTSLTDEMWRYDSEGNPRAMIQAATEKTLNYTGQDFYNLCALRGKGYHDVSYEQNKIIAILSRCWCGDRDDQAFYGNGTSSQYTTGQRDTIGKRDTTTGLNKIWGLEGWVACNWEFMDHVGVNISNFADWKKAGRPSSGATCTPVNGVWHIFDPFTKTERTVQGLTTSGYCIARLKHGKHCDIIASSLNSDTSRWNTCYAAVNYYTNSGGRVVGRANHVANAFGGCVYASAYNASSYSVTHFGARLAFSGTFENESEITS